MIKNSLFNALLELSRLEKSNRLIHNAELLGPSLESTTLQNERIHFWEGLTHCPREKKTKQKTL